MKMSENENQFGKNFNHTSERIVLFCFDLVERSVDRYSKFPTSIIIIDIFQVYVEIYMDDIYHKFWFR